MIVTHKNLPDLPDGEHTAGGGLFLLVRKGSKIWYYRYVKDGKRHRVTVGNAKTLSLTGAKAKVLEMKKKIADGLEPEELSPQKGVYFADYYLPAIERIEKVRAFKNPKHAAQWRSTIETYALPVLKNLPLHRIRLRDVLAVLDPIWHEKPETASRLRGRLEAIFSLAIAEGIMTENPARWKDGLESFLPASGRIRAVKHHSAMPFEELKAFTKRLKDSPGVALQAILFGILTAARVQEVVLARWEEFDLKSAVWIIPAERMKMKRIHRVPLSRQAVEIIRAQREDTPKACPLVFPSPITGGPMSIDTPRTMIQKITGADYTMHGFRSTFRDWCEENFVHPSLSERALAHVQGDKVVAAYQRSDLLEQRRPVMQQWADAIMPQ